MEIIFQEQSSLLFFILLPLFAIIYFLFARRMRSDALQFANFEALQRIKAGITNKETFGWGKYINRGLLSFLLKLLILAVLILLFTKPQILVDESFQQYKYFIAIDGSFSMFTDDIAPTRFSAAKNFSKNLLSQLEKIDNTTEVGLLVFSGDTFILKKLNQPFSPELFVKLDEIKKPVGVDTNIMLTLTTAANFFLADESEHKTKNIILLITDGADTYNSNDTRNDIINYLNQQEISIYSIGVGTDKGGNVEGFNVTYDLKLDENYLQALSSDTLGEYFRITDSSKFPELIEKLTVKQNIKKPINIILYLQYTLLALLLILWFFVSPRYATIP